MAMRVNGSFSLLFFFIVMPFIFTSVFTADKKLYLQDASGACNQCSGAQCSGQCNAALAVRETFSF